MDPGDFTGRSQLLQGQKFLVWITIQIANTAQKFRSMLQLSLA